MTELDPLIHGKLRSRTRRTLADPGSRRAAVLIPLFVKRGEPRVLFTRRTEMVEHHKGQISFPGGAADREDPDAPATALRETEEELGIPRDRVQVLGVLDDLLATVSGFIITPVVGTIPHPFPLRVNEAEIAEVFSVPLGIFRDPGRLRVEQREPPRSLRELGAERGGERIDVYFYTHGPHEIWGVTARIMKSFIDAVFGESAP